ncbi:MAG: hypothetical protein C4581_00770 [Nitrospiraceae bacterium]|nr:MAG: hypothetical protein C4581_00770 [Nitrospiraceae bacterium]
MSRQYNKYNIVKNACSFRNNCLKVMLVTIVSVLVLYAAYNIEPVVAGTYLNSAHGNSSYGVKRSAAGFPADYTKGLCGHCHEQHASVDGSEPEPIEGSPSSYGLFYSNYLNQTDNICFQCHTDISSYQTGGSLVNRSYSFRAGGWTVDPINDVMEAFSIVSPGTSHNLDDISTLVTSKSWNYTSDSNPCNACHNPHAAQGDPVGSPNSVKSSGTRGWPVSRPSLHSKDNNAWGLWGDGSGEKMSDYAGLLKYQAPYRYNSTTTYEPDGSTTQDGTNLADYVTFCTDCHNTTNTIYSTTLGRNLRTINWVTAKHGKGAAVLDSASDISPPYQDAQLGNYVLACTDCHEPHGSSNVFFIRGEVNGSVPVTVITEAGTNNGPIGRCNSEWTYLCGKCHKRLGASDGHAHPAYIPPDTGGCSDAACHSGDDGCIYTSCGTCHYHESDTVFGTPYGEKLF